MAHGGDHAGGARLPHLPALDGLRGVAVAAVLLYHGGLEGAAGGYLGVSTFFTLSGFLITSLLVREHALRGRIDLRAFWAARVRRILPAALATLVAVALVGAVAADPAARRALLGDALAAAGWVVNWWFVVSRREYMDQFAPPSPVQHFWSLAIEEQFYLVAPVVVAAVLGWSRGSRRLLAAVLGALAVASAGWLVHLAGTDAATARLYFGTDTRAAEILAGAVLALGLGAGTPVRAGWRRRAVGVLGAGGLAASVWCWTALPHGDVRLYQGGLAAYTLATTAVVAAAAQPSGAVRALLSAEPLCWLGRVSYGAYLYHFPLFLWLTPARTELDGAALLALRVGVSLGVAALSHRLLELPVRERRLAAGARAWVAAPVAVGVAAGVLAAASLRPDAAAEGSGAPALARPCAPDAVRVLVVGDSVAEGIAAGLARWSGGDGRLAVTALTQKGCGLAPGGDLDRDAAVRAPVCLAWGRRWRRAVDRLRPDVVLVYTAGWDMLARRMTGWDGPRGLGDAAYDAWLRDAFGATADALAAGGARVVWLTAICSRAAALGPQGPSDPARVAHLNDAVIRAVAAARADQVAVVDLFAAVCPRGRFSDRLGGRDGARPDGVHFSPAGADWLAAWLGPQLAREGRRRAADVAL